MQKEKNRLLTMLEEHKISQDDYLLLCRALQKKSIFSDLENSYLLNPFQRIAGFKALALGLMLMLMLTLLGLAGNVYFDGIFGYIVPLGLKAMQPNFLLLLYQNVIAIIVTATLFLVSALLFRQKRIRIIDFYGTVALSRYPILISLLFTMLDIYLEPMNQDISTGIELHFSIISTVSNFIFMACLVWQIITYFFALKEASGLEGKSLWYSFIITLLLGDVIGTILTRLFLYS